MSRLGPYGTLVLKMMEVYFTNYTYIKFVYKHVCVVPVFHCLSLSILVYFTHCLVICIFVS